MIPGARWAVALVAAGVLLALVHDLVMAQQPTGPIQPRQRPATDPHAVHGTPMGWKFSLPKGDPARGRAVFVKLECYACHEVTGEKFPAPVEQAAKAGPELSQMAPLHDAEYFAEAVINPTATIEKGKGYEAADGSSKMPDFNDEMTVKELIDLVAYLRSLTPAPAKSGGHHGH